MPLISGADFDQTLRESNIGQIERVLTVRRRRWRISQGRGFFIALDTVLWKAVSLHQATYMADSASRLQPRHNDSSSFTQVLLIPPVRSAPGFDSLYGLLIDGTVA